MSVSKDQLVNKLREYDGSGAGLLNEKLLRMALGELTLPFTQQEIAGHIAVGKQVSGDASGKIKLEDFATYLSFEIVKKNAMGGGQPAASQPAQQTQQVNPSDNPFEFFGFDDTSNNNNNNNNTTNNAAPATNNNANIGYNSGPKVGVMKHRPDIAVNVNNQNQNSNMMVTVTPVNRDEEKLADSKPVDMRNIASPTQANEQELPDWFGHSLTSPVHGQTVNNAADTWDIFGFDDNNNNNNNGGNGNGNDQGGLKTPATPNVTYKPDTPGNKPTRAQTPGGLIAPPRQAKKKSPKSKTRPSSPAKEEEDPFFSFGQANQQMDQEAATAPTTSATSATSATSVASSPSVDENGRRKPKTKRKAKKSFEQTNDSAPSTPDANNDKAVANNDKPAQPAPQKKKRHKTDAIAQMKRGTAMLKYGRHGFPHFRRFQLSKDNRRLLWYSRKKSLAETHIEVKDIKDVLEGQQTEVFKQCTQRTLKKASFSIIYGAKLKTLDVVAKSQEEAQLWTKGLKGLMKANKVGKLHKVVQILVDVPYVDITKPKGKEPTRDPNSKQQFSTELIQTIEHTLRESKKTFEVIVKLAESKNVLKSSEYENVSVLVSELEQRLNEVETGLNQKNVDFIELKRDVWVLKVDVTVLEEKLKVLSKGGSDMYL